jgi:predicted Zn-dependent protease
MSPQQDLTTLKIVRLGRALSRAEIKVAATRILESLGDVLSRFQILDYQPPDVDQIDAGLLTQALEQELGGHILGVTEADLIDRSGPDFFNFVFGCKDNRNDVAVVSTRRLGGRDPDRLLSRLLKISLHELGHNFGLMHHYSFEPAIDGGYCPMTKGDFNRHGERSYVRSVIDARGFHFCERCRNFLRLAHRATASP